MLNPKSQIGKIYILLSANRRKRVSILQLNRVSGSLCVSTKCSELRRKFNLDIENKKETQKNGMVYSYYRLNKGQIKK